MKTTHFPPTPIDEAAIIAEAQKAAWLYDDINTACPYPWGSLAERIFTQAFDAARAAQNSPTTGA